MQIVVFVDAETVVRPAELTSFLKLLTNFLHPAGRFLDCFYFFNVTTSLIRLTVMAHAVKGTGEISP